MSPLLATVFVAMSGVSLVSSQAYGTYGNYGAYSAPPPYGTANRIAPAPAPYAPSEPALAPYTSVSVESASAFVSNQLVNMTFTNMSCLVAAMSGTRYVRDSKNYAVVYLQVMSGDAVSVDVPWSLVLEGSSYLNVTQAWGFDISALQSGAIEGKVIMPYEALLSSMNVVDLGFVTEIPAIDDDITPTYFTIDGEECSISSF